ncbi:hypothetical protein [Chelatococcus composti]|mgnify:CR=1 FL=1|jgi:hypothetical protein|uniref:Uncharacterized protein n=1 Tax=Chelatococcus composti TaxID=1743235 RepID=A0A841KAJ4_9HYPH|nr:hypothetical protein [Chelatococcus composti]MBB6169527.1 hypothetical protein [Chelatococcus composti]MBS7736112.1 hypothetical protein [Chelatococcus composti]GGG48382.1 hypothetical protein GCM10008026_32100 [Chelatococcus composti]
MTTAMQGGNPATNRSRRPWSRGRVAALLIVAVAAAVIIGANAHLVIVALSSQPDCVTHLKTPGGSEGAFRAAKSSC